MLFDVSGEGVCGDEAALVGDIFDREGGLCEEVDGGLDALVGEEFVGCLADELPEGSAEVFSGDIVSVGDGFDGPGDEGLSGDLFDGLLCGWELCLSVVADVAEEVGDEGVGHGGEVCGFGVACGVCGVDDAFELVDESAVGGGVDDGSVSVSEGVGVLFDACAEESDPGAAVGSIVWVGSVVDGGFAVAEEDDASLWCLVGSGVVLDDEVPLEGGLDDEDACGFSACVVEPVVSAGGVVFAAELSEFPECGLVRVGSSVSGFGGHGHILHDDTHRIKLNREIIGGIVTICSVSTPEYRESPWHRTVRKSPADTRRT